MLFWCLCIGLFICCVLASRAIAQEEDDPIYKAWFKNPEVVRCWACHFEPGRGRPTDFCGLEEARTWVTQDKHAVSRVRIEPLLREQFESFIEAQAGNDEPSQQYWRSLLGDSNELSARICQALGYDLSRPEGFQEFRDNCLTCHAGFKPSATGQQPEFDTNTANRPGISCGYCHQLENNTTWIGLHGSTDPQERLAWRMRAPEEKAVHGMRNLMDAPRQAELCVACHVGDHQQGMFVSHAMYSAGHPVLPGFELEHFLASMPKHWRDVTQTNESLVDFAQRETYLGNNFANLTPSLDNFSQSAWGTRGLLIGAIESARASTQLVAEAGRQHGDYALYDCAGCHHDLKQPSLRQQRTARVPGRPQLMEWPRPLVELALEFSGESASVRSAQRRLHQVVNRTPFGDADDCRTAATDYAQELEKAGNGLAELVISPQHSKRALKALTQTPIEELIDYQAARQILWAIQVLAKDLEKSEGLSPQARRTIEELGSTKDGQFVSLKLPATRSQSIFSGFTLEELKRMANYKPQQLFEQLQRLSEQL